MVGWHHWLNGCESELTLGVGDVHGGPACCDSWGRKKLDMIEQLNWNEYIWVSFNDLHETGAYYTEWSKPERKTPIQYTNSYVELRKMVSITLYVRQQKRHRCIEQSFGLCGRGWGWDGLGEWHWNMNNIIFEMNHPSSFDAWYRILGTDALGWPRGMRWRRRWEGGSGWGAHVHPWRIHVDVWQSKYNILK